MTQGIVFASIILTVTWWATGVVDKNIACIFLITAFIIFSGAPMDTIFHFPLTPVFYLLAFSFILSEGITKSGLVTRISTLMLKKYGQTPRKLIFLSFMLGFILTFFIPQPFPRVILVSVTYLEFFKTQNIDKAAKSVLMFSIFVASTCTSMFFLNGDVLLNYAALQVGGIKLDWITWAFYMAPPMLIINILIYILFIIIFRREISVSIFSSIKDDKVSTPFSNDEKKAFIILASIMVLWMSEPLHKIDSAWIGLAGVLAMYFTGLIKIKDVRKVNFSLLLFITAAFSIGGVLSFTGIANSIYSRLAQFLPGSGGILYFGFMIIIVMFLHLFVGGATATLTVSLPGLLLMNAGRVSPIAITLIAYTVVNTHYIIPFQQATIMLGVGDKHYPSSYVIRFGIALTFLIFISVLFIEIPWWRLIGLL